MKTSKNFPICICLLIVLGLLQGCNGENRAPADQADSSSDSQAKEKARAECCPNAATDWPQWRGLNRDGHGAAGALLESWPEAGPPVPWRRAIGSGFSSVVVKGDRLYTAWSDEGSEKLFGLDVATGETLWSVDLGEDFEEEFGNGPRSTPLVDARNVVYMLSSRARLVAVQGQDGKQVWSVDLFKKFGAGSFRRGYASSPLLADDLVVVHVGPRRGAVVAVSRDTGKVAWAALGGRSESSSPVMATLAGRRQIVSTLGYGLAAVDPSDGSMLWRYPWPTEHRLNITTPVILPGDRVLISSGYDQGSSVVRVSESEGQWSVEEIWLQKRFRNHFNTSVHVDGFLYGYDNAILKCINAQTGEEVWKTRGFGKGSLIAAGERLVALTESGELVLVKASPESFEEIARAEILSGKCWTSPTLADGRVYLRSHEELVAVDLRPSSEPSP